MPVRRRRSLLPGEKIRVLVVDDSVVVRRLITRALEGDAEFNVLGAAANGAIALQRIPQLHPDVLTLDIEMPQMDGLETLRRLRIDFPDLRVLMCSTLTEHGAAVTLDALALGADDYVTKPSAQPTLDQSINLLRSELIPKIKQFFSGPPPIGGTVLPAGHDACSCLAPSSLRIPPAHPRVVAIGTSTGGPAALAEVLPQFPADFPLPVLVVQHMPPFFTRLLAERLAPACQLRLREAAHGDPVIAGNILIAPGDFHMKVAASGSDVHVLLDQSLPQNFCRPAVDALFCSVADVYGGAAIAAVLTGMGQDGLRGVGKLKRLGAAIVAQDQESSVVWGMPGAVVNAGLADQIVPLDRFAQEILRRLERG